MGKKCLFQWLRWWALSPILGVIAFLLSPRIEIYILKFMIRIQKWIHYEMDQKHPETIPSGKRLHNYGKSPFLMGKTTINGIFQYFSIAMWVYQSIYCSLESITQVRIGITGPITNIRPTWCMFSNGPIPCGQQCVSSIYSCGSSFSNMSFPEKKMIGHG